MADGAYERRAGREAELKRFERILKDIKAFSAGKTESSEAAVPYIAQNAQNQVKPSLVLNILI